LLKDSLLYDLSPQSAAISEQRRTLLQTYFSASPANMKIQMLNELMNVYTKLSYASNIFDYVQTTLLKMIFLQSDAGRQNQISTVQKSRRPAQKISESRSEPAETKPKTKEKSSSHPLADKFWASDVSRETSNPQSDENSDSDFDENFLLSLLVGADKNSRKADEEQYSNLPLYENSLEFGKFATSLKGTNLIASAEQYLLVQAKNQMKANLINRLQKDEGYEILTGKMLSKKKKVFAVAPDKRQKLIETFKQRSKEGTLPAPAKFDEMQKQEVKEQSTPDYLKTLFSDLQVVDD
jgi:DNA polymerase-3 subunit gamma/tau